MVMLTSRASMKVSPGIQNHKTIIPGPISLPNPSPNQMLCRVFGVFASDENSGLMTDATHIVTKMENIYLCILPTTWVACTLSIADSLSSWLIGKCPQRHVTSCNMAMLGQASRNGRMGKQTTHTTFVRTLGRCQGLGGTPSARRRESLSKTVI